MATVSVRYITDDLDAAGDFYVERLGFDVEMAGGSGVAMLSRGDLPFPFEAPCGGAATRVCDALARRLTAAAESTWRGRGGTADARWPSSPARGLESNPARGVGPRARGRSVARGRGALPERHRRGGGRQPDPARGSLGQPDRAPPGRRRLSNCHPSRAERHRQRPAAQIAAVRS